MWIKTKNGGAVNMEHATKIEIVEITVTEYEVAVSTCNVEESHYYAIATFDTEDEAKKCVEEIISALNGGKVGYSFSWLKAATPAEEKPVEKPADKFVDDGIAW